MKFNLKKNLFAAALLFGMLFSTNTVAQSSCCTKGKEASATPACGSSSSTKEATSGCSPSACRGAKTKFGEAKAISDLRLSLITLKVDMEKYTSPKFDEKSYDIHGIVGESDEESLKIIVKEVKLVEDAFVAKLNHKPTDFTLPENKAKQVQYLISRIDDLKQLL